LHVPWDLAEADNIDAWQYQSEGLFFAVLKRRFSGITKCKIFILYGNVPPSVVLSPTAHEDFCR